MMPNQHICDLLHLKVFLVVKIGSCVRNRTRSCPNMDMEIDEIMKLIFCKRELTLSGFTCHMHYLNNVPWCLRTPTSSESIKLPDGIFVTPA